MQCAGTISPEPSRRLAAEHGQQRSVGESATTLTVPAGSTSFQFSMATAAVTTATVVSVEIFDAQSGIPLWGQIVSVTP